MCIASSIPSIVGVAGDVVVPSAVVVFHALGGVSYTMHALGASALVTLLNPAPCRSFAQA